jgi:polyisoprenoid-binding protein YceI
METLEATPTTTKTVWNLDAVHSNLDFTVKHMMISNVRGNFKDFSVNVIADNDDFSNAKIEVEINVDSIHTAQEQREAHLKSPDFFDAANFPKATFTSTSIEKTDEEGGYKVTGDLTIRGITKPVVLDVEFNGVGNDPYGNKKAGFDFKTVINRSDFGMNFNAPLEAGGVMVSNNVKISGGLEMLKQKEA